jgi:signal transduction histidine kinase
LTEHWSKEAWILSLPRQQQKRRARQIGLLVSMSHGRTPMNAIIGMSHLAGTELTPRQSNYIHKIQGAGRHLLNIINDILDIAKIEAGKLTVEHIEFDVQTVLDNVSDLIAEKSAAKGLEFVIEVAPNVPARLIGDPLRFGQVLIITATTRSNSQARWVAISIARASPTRCHAVHRA